MAAWVISRWVDRTLAIGVGMGTAAYCHYDLTGLLQKRGDAGLLLFDPKPKAKAPKVEVRRGSVSRARARALIVTSHAVSPVRRPRSAMRIDLVAATTQLVVFFFGFFLLIANWFLLNLVLAVVCKAHTESAQVRSDAGDQRCW